VGVGPWEKDAEENGSSIPNQEEEGWFKIPWNLNSSSVTVRDHFWNIGPATLAAP
jgi:hypothetical protein